MNLNQAAAAMYSDEDTTKVAEAELFAKLAATNGIDLTALEDEEVIALYNHTFNKVAEEDESEKDEAKKDDEDDEEEKKEAAAREHHAKLAHAIEQQHADDLGVRMAQSYVRELNKIGSALQEQAATEGAADLGKEAAMPPALAKALDKVRGAVGKQHGPVSSTPAKGSFHGPEISGARKAIRSVTESEGVKKGLEFGKKHKTTIGVGAGAASLGAGGGYAAGRKKESSVIDQLALECAVKIAEAEGTFDLGEVADRVSAVHILGLDESSKLASTVEQQVEIRALEYLEAAGYPVVWE